MLTRAFMVKRNSGFLGRVAKAVQTVETVLGLSNVRFSKLPCVLRALSMEVNIIFPGSGRLGLKFWPGSLDLPTAASLLAE